MYLTLDHPTKTFPTRRQEADVTAVDGVPSHGEAAPLDFAVLQRVAEFNDRACRGSDLPVGHLMYR